MLLLKVKKILNKISLLAIMFGNLNILIFLIMKDLHNSLVLINIPVTAVVGNLVLLKKQKDFGDKVFLKKLKIYKIF